MSLTVRDVMNPQLLYVDEDDSAEVVRSRILAYGVSGVPVLDRSYRAVGFVRALCGREPRHPARFDGDCTSAAAFRTRATPDAQAAARRGVCRVSVRMRPSRSVMTREA